VDKTPKPYTERQERFGRRVTRLGAKFNIFLYRKSNGRFGSKFPRTHAPICLLTTTGRHSGLARTTPLLYMEDGERVIIVASQGGMSRNPDWFFNIEASPKVTVDIEGDAQAMLARVATADEKAVLWPRLVEMHPPFATYQQRTTRDIPVVICTPGA
jgi:F420H(2)-dependent quinone reductase